MRKNGSFSALLYRELLLLRKSLTTYLIMTFIYCLMPVLVILSIRYGNLAMLPEHFLNNIRGGNDLMLKLFAVISPCMLSSAASESAVFDTQIKWDRFRRSTPVTPLRMALAKYALVSILLVLSVVVAVGMIGLCTSLLGTSMTKTDIAMIMALITIINMMCVVSQTFIMLFRSVDKGMLAMLGCSVAVSFLAYEKLGANITVDRLLSGAEALLPLTPVILMGILLLGCGLTTFIYARREK